MSISLALSNANSGLSAASRRADVVSNNIANALTPGYAKRSINVSEQVVGGRGAGVSVDGVTRATDLALTTERRLGEAALGRDQTLSTAYAELNTALGEPEDGFSLFSQYQNLETSLRTLAQTPESIAGQSEVLAAARALATTFNRLSDQTTAMRENADGQIATQVDFVNSALKRLEDINKDIAIASGVGRDVTALEDQRKALTDDVASILPVREVPRNDGRIDLMTNDGVFLLAGTARELSFSRTIPITPDMAIDDGDLSRLTVEGTDLTPGAGGLSLKSGSLAGLFAVRDTIAPTFQAQIDGLAQDVIERFENIDTTLPPGAPGLFTDNGLAFAPGAETGLAGRIAVNSAVDPNNGGALWRLRDGLGAATQGPPGTATFINRMLDNLTEVRLPPAGTGLNGQLTASGTVADITSLVGSARISAEGRTTALSAQTQAIIDAEQAATGVDTDTELQKLLLIESAFAANARVIQTADQMLQTLLEL